jgi:hypothetical protein
MTILRLYSVNDGIIDECEAVGGMRIGKEHQSAWRKSAPVPLCPPQISHYINWDQTWATTLGSRQLTTWAVVWPSRDVEI